MRNGLCSEYLFHLLPLRLEIIQPYKLQYASDYKTIRSTCTHLYYNSFLPPVVRDWNELPRDTKNAVSICAFKRGLKSTMIDVLLFYRDGKHICQLYHAI